MIPIYSLHHLTDAVWVRCNVSCFGRVSHAWVRVKDLLLSSTVVDIIGKLGAKLLVFKE